MSHAVETMAYAGALPWHGLGVNVESSVTVEEMQIAAGLDWMVSLAPLTARVGDKDVAVKDNFALIRNTDHRVFDVVGSRWNVPQPKDILGFFKDFVEAGGATLETAGSLHGGKVIWALADLKSNFTIKGSQDKIKNYLLLASPYQQGRATIARVTPTRVVCANTMAMAMSGTTLLEKRWSHATAFDAEQAAESLELVRDNAFELNKSFNKLKSLRMTERDALEVLAPVYQDLPQGKEYPAYAGELVTLPSLMTPTLEKVLVAYHEGVGADVGTGWGVLQGATYYSNHVARRDADGRMSSAWMGKEARRVNAVYDTLVAMAD